VPRVRDRYRSSQKAGLAGPPDRQRPPVTGHRDSLDASAVLRHNPSNEEHDCNRLRRVRGGEPVAWFRMMGIDSVKYHRRTVLDRGDDHQGQALAYYGSRGETPLQWGGQIADRLGLTGAVDDASYESIFGPGGARDPDLGTRLARTERPGVELVVAAHKSVAVLGVIGRADDMHAILDAETEATMAFLERWFARQGGRRGRSQRRTRTGGLLWAATRHATSRAGDPAPHDHVLVANLTEMLDDRGGWKALDTGGLRDLVHAATMAGRLAGAATAVELGYAITPDHGPSGKLDHWALAGVPREVTELFSKRAAEVDEAIAAGTFTSYRARGIAARDTRDAKGDEPQEALLMRWWDELAALGWAPRTLDARLRIVNEREGGSLRALSPPERQALVAEVVGPNGPLSERKVFTRAHVTRLVAPRLYGCHPDELDRVIESVLQHPAAIPLVGLPGARERAWASASALAVEAAIEDLAERHVHRDDAPAVTAQQVLLAISATEDTIGHRLTDGQRYAVRAVTTSGRGLDLVVGVAGSGRTTALDAARAA
jgi:conjugative relaxase-like TrwC/TraI family protein